MPLSVTQNYSAIVPGASFAQFVATGGTPPYTYSVIPGGSGGTIDSATGNYQAASQMTAYKANQMLDTIQAMDADLNIATASILVATPLFLVCDILQTQLNLAPGHIYVWDQKAFQPTDSSLYIAVSLISCKPFGNAYKPATSDGGQVFEYVSMYGKIDLDIISRGPAARDQKELVVLALNSTYSQQQQEANGFYIGKIPIMGGFINLSQVDGAAIPYRYKISYALQYQTNLTASVQYYDTFQAVQTTSN